MRFTLLATFFATCELLGSLHTQQAPVINAPQLPAAPALDANLDGAPWQAASCAPLAISADSDGLAAAPNGRFYAGYAGGSLFVAFITTNMDRMPESTVTTPGGPVWKDDSFEIHLASNTGSYQLVVNSQGVATELRDGQVASDILAKTACRTIGAVFAAADSDRGFAVVAEIPLKALGKKAVPGQEWKFQAALNLKDANPHALWARSAEFKLGAGTGSLILGGKPNRLEEVKATDGGRRLVLRGRMSEPPMFRMNIVNDGDNAVPWRDGQAEVDVPGGAEYKLLLACPGFNYQFSGQSKLEIPFLAVPNPGRNAFYVQCDTAKLPEKYKLPVRLSIRREKKTLWGGDPVDMGKFTGVFKHWISYEGWDAGPCELVISSAPESGDGEEIAVLKLKVPARPAWDGLAVKMEDSVPTPFTPVKAEKKSASVWGRKYSFGAGGFLDQIEAAGRKLLASPVTFRGTVDGTPLNWKVASWKLRSHTPTTAVYDGEAAAGGLRAKTTATIGFDGLVRLDCELSPIEGDPVTVTDLRFVVPLKREFVTMFLQAAIPGGTVGDPATLQYEGDIPEEGRACQYVPYFWVGDADSGVEWMCEGPVGWKPAGSTKAIELIPDAQAVTLAANIASGSLLIDKLPLRAPAQARRRVQ
jgi:hypothetical protein